MPESFVVQRETQIAAPRASVFAFLTDPEKIVQWMGSEAVTEMHPGGLYLLKGVGSATARGTFRRCGHLVNPPAGICWLGCRSRHAHEP